MARLVLVPVKVLVLVLRGYSCHPPPVLAARVRVVVGANWVAQLLDTLQGTTSLGRALWFWM